MAAPSILLATQARCTRHLGTAAGKEEDPSWLLGARSRDFTAPLAANEVPGHPQLHGFQKGFGMFQVFFLCKVFFKGSSFYFCLKP